MPDHELTPDPLDQAYAQAEAILDDDAVRAARRARVLGAVAASGQPEPANAAPVRRRIFFGQGRWLAAASVAGLSLLIGLKFYQPPETPPPVAAPPPPAAAQVTNDQAAAAQAVAPVSIAPAPRSRPVAAPTQDVAAPAAKPQTPPAEANSARDSQALAAPAPQQPPPPPAPRPAPPPAPVTSGAFAARAAPPAAAASEESGTAVEQVVVTSERRNSSIGEAPAAVTAMGKLASAPTPAKAAALRAAAAAGRLSEVRALLNEGLPVDTPDEAGDTALIKAVRGKHADAAALLRRQGANLDLRNKAGDSARDLAEALGDKAMNRALGL